MVSRTSVVVRTAVPDDLPALNTLWQQLRGLGRDGQRNQRGLPLVPAATDELLAGALDAPDCRVTVAVHDGEVVGLAMLSIGRVGQLLDRRAVHLTHMVVSDGFRHHGAGRALVGSAVTFADEVGAEEVVVSVLPALRDANRFYARLGFAPLVVRRVAPVSALRRRLAALDGGALAQTRRRRLVLRGRTAAAARGGARTSDKVRTPPVAGAL